jgi:hypothetical protein
MLQGEFSLVMAYQGMHDPLVLEGQQTEVLENAIQAYRLFLKLVLLPHLPKVYPTWDIDLVWHTHQLQGTEYKYVTLSAPMHSLIDTLTDVRHGTCWESS